MLYLFHDNLTLTKNLKITTGLNYFENYMYAACLNQIKIYTTMTVSQIAFIYKAHLIPSIFNDFIIQSLFNTSIKS